MNIYDVYMDEEEAVISAEFFYITYEGIVVFKVGDETVAAFNKPEIWRWIEKRQVEEK